MKLSLHRVAFAITASLSFASLAACSASTIENPDHTSVIEGDSHDVHTEAWRGRRPPRCTPKTCFDTLADCGTIFDGCGGLVVCGPSSCPGDQTCGGGGMPNVCGGGGVICHLNSCADLHLECGLADDGCGGLMDCGSTCASGGDTCGGGGLPNVCGHPACVPQTCASAHASCGVIADGCGGSVNCGACPLPFAAKLLTAPGAGGGPQVMVRDIVTEAVQRSFWGYAPSFVGGVRIAGGDVDGDGVSDIVTGAGPGGAPHVQAFSAGSASAARSFFAFETSFTGGVFVAAGDVDGDGAADIVVGAGAGRAAEVHVYSGRSGALIRNFAPYGAAFAGGVTVAVGDVDGDGYGDIVTGAGPGGGPHVQVFSGRTGGVLRSFFAYDTTFTGGVFVGAGDIDGDHRAEVVTTPGAGGGPHVKVWSGATGGVTRSFWAYDTTFLGSVTVAVGDADGDGLADIITGAGPGGGPHVKVFKGSNEALLHSFFAYDTRFTGGVFVGWSK